MAPKVTAVISVYNTAQFLSKCIESVTAQALKDIEIIIVNDGSDDGGIEIIKEFASKDNRIVVFDIENLGVSNARNLGLQNAKGEYIIFIDSDDYIEPDMLKTMYDEATAEEADLAVCNLRRVFDNYAEPEFLTMPKEKVLCAQENNHSLTADIIGGRILLGLSLFNKLFKTSFLRRTGLLFEERNKIYAEDAFFYFKTLKFIKKICVVDKIMYNYYQRSSSVSNTYKKDLARRCENFISELESYYKGVDLRRAFADRSWAFLIEIFYNETHYKEDAVCFKKAIKNKFFREKTATVDINILSVKQKIIFILYRLKFYRLVYAMFNFSSKGVGKL